jgi:uncharacterized protein (DUF2345 family)
MLHDSKDQPEPAPDKLAPVAAMAHSAKVIGASAGGSASESGGAGKATAYAEPHMQMSSPDGIAATTPESVIVSAGDTSSITAGQDINMAVQGNHHHLVGGISMFTYGKASAGDKPNQETGIRLHAASGKVSTQSQSDETRLTADKAITVASITKEVGIAAKAHVLMTAQGAYLKLEGGNIMLHAPGKVDFKASKKELTGPASSSQVLPQMPLTENWPDVHSQQLNVLNFIGADPETGEALVRVPYSVRDAAGRVIARGTTNDTGDTGRVFTKAQEKVDVFLGEGEWRVFVDVAHAQLTADADEPQDDDAGMAS